MTKTCIKCHSVLTDVCLPDDADELCQSCAIVVDDDAGDWITVELESRAGPRLLADADATPEDIEAEIPSGWDLDWTSGVRTDSGRTSFALVCDDDDDDDDNIPF